MTKPLSQEEKQLRLVERLTIENAELRNLNKKLLRRGGFALESVLEEIKEALKSDKSKNLIEVLPELKNKDHKDHTEIACLVLSDWHTSEIVKREDTNGINCFNSTILANRLYELTQSVKQIIQIHQKVYKIEKLWIPILGDMINGSIHPDLALTNELSDPGATILAAKLLQFLINDLKTLGLPIEIDTIVGNHSRLTVKMPAKHQSQLSYDWIVYEMVKNYFSNDPNIKINVNNGQIGLVKQYGWRFVLEHGIDVRNGHEEEFEDKIRALFDDPTYRAATQLKDTTFDNIIIGNLHKQKILERTIVNGTLTGQNELGMSWRLKPIKAQQVLFGISRKHVRTWMYNVDVTHVTSESSINSYSKYVKGYLKEHGKR